MRNIKKMHRGLAKTRIRSLGRDSFPTVAVNNRGYPSSAFPLRQSASPVLVRCPSNTNHRSFVSSSSNDKSGGTTTNGRGTTAKNTSPRSLELNNMEHAWVLQRTKELQEDMPFGSISSALWLEGINEVLHFWNLQRTPESVHLSLDVLERFLLEQQILLHNNHDPQRIELSRQLLNTDLLNSIVQNWHSILKNQQQHPHGQAQLIHEDVALLLTPQQLLDRIDDNRIRFSQNTSSLQPDIRTYNMIMDGATRFAYDDPREGITFIRNVFDQILHSNDSRMRCYLDTVSYNTLINAYSLIGDAVNAQAILESMLESDIVYAQPDQQTCWTVIMAWASSQRDDAPAQGQALLDRMQKNSNLPSPNAHCYTALLQCWAKYKKTDTIDIGAQADKVLEEMERDPHIEPSMNIVAYNLVLDAHARMGQAVQSEQLLQKILSSKRVRPTRHTFAAVLKAWSRSKDPQAPEKALEMLRQIQNLSTGIQTGDEDKDHDGEGNYHNIYEEMDAFQLNAIHYTTLLKCWAESGRPDAGEMAESFLREMLERHDTMNPDVIAYNTVLHAWARVGNAPRAAALLQHMYEEFVQQSTSTGSDDKAPVARPDVMSFNAVLNACAKSRDQRLVAPEMAEMILERMKDQLVDTQPDIYSYNTVLHCWAVSGRPEAGERAERMLSEMMMISKEASDDARTPIVQPDTVSYNTVLNALARVGNATRAEELLRTLVKNYGSRQPQPDIESFNIVLNAWSQSGHSNAPERAEKLLNQMRTQYREHVTPDIYSYNSLLHCWARSKRPEAGRRVKAIIEHLNSNQQDGKNAIKLNIFTYNIIINTWAAEGNTQQAEEWLQRMYDEYKDGNRSLKPNTRIFSTVLKAWSQSTESYAPERAESILRTMQNVSESTNNDLDLTPNVVSYAAVITCWARSDRPCAGERAQALLDEMQQKYERDGNSSVDVKPNRLVYSAVMNAWIRSGKVEEAYKLLQRMDDNMVEPDQFIFNSLLHAYCEKAGDDDGEAVSPERAEAILRRMAQYDSITIDASAYRTVIRCWAMSQRKNSVDSVWRLLNEMEATGDEKLKPNRGHYVTTIVALINCGRGADATKFLESMVSSEDKNLAPDASTYSAIFKELSSMSKTRTPDKAEAFLKRLCELAASNTQMEPPDVTSFNVVLNSWAKTVRRDSGNRAEALLCYMESLLDGRFVVKPDIVSYNTVLKAHATGGNPDRAETLFHSMNEKFRSGNALLKPDAKTFATLVTAWTRSKSSKAPERAEAILRYMVDDNLSIRPDVVLYNAVLNCWASSGRKNAGDRAQKILNEMQLLSKSGNDAVTPNDVSFQTVRKALWKSGKFGRSRAIMER